MNRFLKVNVALVIVAMTGAAILKEIVAPKYMGSNAQHGISTGWQRNLVWNLAVLIIWSPLVSVFGGSIYVQFCSTDSGRHWSGDNHFIHFLSAPGREVKIWWALSRITFLQLIWMIGWKLR